MIKLPGAYSPMILHLGKSLGSLPTSKTFSPNIDQVEEFFFKVFLIETEDYNLRCDARGLVDTTNAAYAFFPIGG